MQNQWKLYGPDLSGTYGGMNGVGGLDGMSPYLNLFEAAISDARGDILGYYSPQLGEVVWSQSRPTAYGAVPGYRPAAFDSGANLAQASAWRGIAVDPTGYYQIGARTYDPVSGVWLSPDPLGSTGLDPNGYSFCGGDPIDYFDPFGLDPSLFQVLAPVTFSATGARPYTGSLAGDVQVSRGFYMAAAPVLVPGRVVLSQPFQRGMQVVGGTTETLAGAAAIPESGGFGTGVGVLAIGHGLDTIQAGIRGTPTFTAQGMMALGASPTFASVADASLGVGLNFGAGMLRAPMSAGGTVIHLTSEENAATILGEGANSGKIGGQFGIFGLRAGQVPESLLARRLLTGVGNVETPIVINGEAVGAFRPPPLVGPFSELRAALGVRSTSLGSIDLRSGSFVPNEVLNGEQFSRASLADQFLYYSHEARLMAPDILFGMGRIGMANAQGHIYEAGGGICKNPSQ